MFSGIVEVMGIVENIRHDVTNIHFEIQVPFIDDVYIDQSISHNGVCLTVVKINQGESTYTVTAIEETLNKTNLGNLKKGDVINLERAMIAGSRFDGHFVQGHVDTTAKCIEIKDVDGSRYFSFTIDSEFQNLIVDKGSICLNGVSLTIVECIDDTFSVAIIPYTYDHTSFKSIRVGDDVNVEFDILGKYILKYLSKLNLKNRTSS